MSTLQNLAQLTSSQIVNCFVLGIVLAGLAGATSFLFGRKNSGIRFAIWFAGLLAVASLFVLSKPAFDGGAAHLKTAEIFLRPEWALYIAGAWALFAAVGIGRVVRGLWRVRALKRSSVPVEASVLASVQQALPPMLRKFALCASEQIRVPAALGFFTPMILLPEWAIRELSPEELSTVVLHEAAHLHRWDDWTNLLQKLIRAVLFFHPAVWWIDNRLSVEREISCDDIVLSQTQSARRYAACLVSLAEKTHAHRSLVLVQAAVGHLKSTAQRISKILDGNKRTVKPLLKPAIAAVVAFGGFSFIALRHTPQLVSFSGHNTESSKASSPDKFDYVANVNRAMVNAVPASLHQRSTPAITKTRITDRSQTATQSRRKPRNLTPEATQTQEATNRAEQPTPTIVNAAARTDATPRFVYLLTQTEQYDGLGNVTVTTAVWRIRVTRPAAMQVQVPVLPNKT